MQEKPHTILGARLLNSGAPKSTLRLALLPHAGRDGNNLTAGQYPSGFHRFLLRVELVSLDEHVRPVRTAPPASPRGTVKVRHHIPWTRLTVHLLLTTHRSDIRITDPSATITIRHFL